MSTSAPAKDSPPRVSLIDSVTCIPVTVLVLSASVLFFRMWLSKPYVDQTNARLFEDSLKQDPLIGTRVEGFESFDGAATILVYTSLCQCDAERLRLVLQEKGENIRTVIAVPSPPEALDRASNLTPFRDMFYFDRDYTLKRKLNASFLPRVYLLDVGGVIQWKSETLVDDWSILRGMAIAHQRGLRK